MSRPDKSMSWPCPRCGRESVRDERDGYQRRCPICAFRAASERFCPPTSELDYLVVSPATKRASDAHAKSREE